MKMLVLRSDAATARTDIGAQYEAHMVSVGSKVAYSFVMTFASRQRSRLGVCLNSYLGRPTGTPGGDMSTKRKKRVQDLPVLHPDAAGIDIGASEVFVAVPADRDPEPVRSFATFTRDLHALAVWLQSCDIRSVAVESTSVYWIPLHQILEARGFEVYLVNAQHVKNVPGRKTDVSDLSVDPISALGGFTTGQLPTAGIYLRHSFAVATPGEPDPNGSRACNAYSESAGSDESASAQSFE